MTRILINDCNAELRRRKREHPVEDLPEVAAEDFDALPLKEALARLSTELRAVIALRYFAGLTLAETAPAATFCPTPCAWRSWPRSAAPLLLSFLPTLPFVQLPFLNMEQKIKKENIYPTFVLENGSGLSD